MIEYDEDPPREDRPEPRHAGWIGVGFDGVLAVAPGHVGEGEAVPEVVARVRQLLRDRWPVRVFTERMSLDDRIVIERFCIAHLGWPLPITNAVRVERNGGR